MGGGAAAKKILPDEVVDIGRLKPHPRNYRKHPEHQLRHIAESLRQNGYYRNIIVARDYTILGGHGVVEAARSIGWRRVPVKRVGIGPDDPRALKIVTGDNELGRFAESDDRLLSELLRDILRDDPLGLVGTGYDEEQLAALVMVTRPESEILDFDAAAEWVGMPDFVPGAGDKFILTVQCASAEARREAAAKLGLEGGWREMKNGKIWTGWYPSREKNDLASLAWKESGGRSTRTGKRGAAQ
jgi:hypothetical protein